MTTTIISTGVRACACNPLKLDRKELLAATCDDPAYPRKAATQPEADPSYGNTFFLADCGSGDSRARRPPQCSVALWLRAPTPLTRNMLRPRV
jgi:hypothetical protein